MEDNIYMDFTLAAILVASVLAQTAAAWIAVNQIRRVDTRYRTAWVCVALALALMVERRLVPLWRLVSSGDHPNLADSLFGLCISILMAIGVYGLQRLFVDLRAMANTDTLTGLANRRDVMQRARQEIERAQRTHRPIALLMFDIDHFKHVNDTYGHPAGDVVLREVADIARSSMRHIDSLGRIGGEEFLAILPESDRTNATGAAERLRSAIAAHSFAVGQTPIQVTVSIGVVVGHSNSAEQTVEDLLAAADSALYAAKNNGRNRVEVTGPEI
jgi:diguanylate cyclase (GGDEF)-like protein